MWKYLLSLALFVIKIFTWAFRPSPRAVNWLCEHFLRLEPSFENYSVRWDIEQFVLRVIKQLAHPARKNALLAFSNAKIPHFWSVLNQRMMRFDADAILEFLEVIVRSALPAVDDAARARLELHLQSALRSKYVTDEKASLRLLSRNGLPALTDYCWKKLSPADWSWVSLRLLGNRTRLALQNNPQLECQACLTLRVYREQVRTLDAQQPGYGSYHVLSTYIRNPDAHAKSEAVITLLALHPSHLRAAAKALSYLFSNPDWDSTPIPEAGEIATMLLEREPVFLADAIEVLVNTARDQIWDKLFWEVDEATERVPWPAGVVVAALSKHPGIPKPVRTLALVCLERIPPDVALYVEERAGNWAYKLGNVDLTARMVLAEKSNGTVKGKVNGAH